jgi:hypothetical protein
LAHKIKVQETFQKMSQIAEILKSHICPNTPFYFETIIWDDGSFVISLVHNTVDKLRYKLEYYSEEPNYITNSILKITGCEGWLTLSTNKFKLEK